MLALFQHVKDFNGKCGIQIVCIWRDAGHEFSIAVEATICRYNMQVRIKIEEFPKSLYSNHATGYGVIYGYTCPKIFGQYTPCTKAELYQKLPVIHEIWTEPFWYAKYPLPVGHPIQHFLMELFTELSVQHISLKPQGFLCHCIQLFLLRISAQVTP